jgi:hypothetical protein
LRMEKTATDNQLTTNWLNTQSWAADGQRIHMFNPNIFCVDKCLAKRADFLG